MKEDIGDKYNKLYISGISNNENNEKEEKA
jgi:hypothetical protein